MDYRDVAQAAAIALTSDKLDFRTFELCASGMVDRIEFTRIMSEAVGRTITPHEKSVVPPLHLSFQPHRAHLPPCALSLSATLSPSATIDK